MKVLVLGQGGREHALVLRLSESPSVSEIHAAPGNDGIRRQAICHDWNWKNSEELIKFCRRTDIELVLIGPEEPLVCGLADQLRSEGLLVVGPGADGAQLEGSKIFAKEFMREAKIPTANFEIVSSTSECLMQAAKFRPPYVLKADGLCGGKGVSIHSSLESLKEAAESLFEKEIFGAAGKRALLEEFSPGWELSYLVLTNGSDFQALPIAQDHKRLREGDLGPNTGGMGTVAPVDIPLDLRKQIDESIVRPTLETLKNRDINYRGFIFFGIMVTPEGPSLLEYNCRLGDPETQVVLPLIQNDFGLLMKRLSRGELDTVEFRPLHSACVVLAAPGYPEAPERGVAIVGDLSATSERSYFLISGARKKNGATWETDGGRVASVVGLGNSLEEALERAYAHADLVRWPGLQIRRDIGQKFISSTNSRSPNHT